MSNANPVLPVTYGTVSGSPITGNVNSATLASLRFVTLGGANYVRAVPAGYGDPNPGVAIASSLTALPQTIASGVGLTFSQTKRRL